MYGPAASHELRVKGLEQLGEDIAAAGATRPRGANFTSRQRTTHRRRVAGDPPRRVAGDATATGARPRDQGEPQQLPGALCSLEHITSQYNYNYIARWCWKGKVSVNVHPETRMEGIREICQGQQDTLCRTACLLTN